MSLEVRYIQQESFEILSIDSRKLDNIFPELVQQLEWLDCLSSYSASWDISRFHNTF